MRNAILSVMVVLGSAFPLKSDEAKVIRGPQKLDYGRRMALSPDAQHVALAETRGPSGTWNLKTQEMEIDLGSSQSGVAFSPDSKILAALDYRAVKLWDVKTGKLLRTLAVESGFDEAMTFSGDGKTLAVQIEENVDLFDVTTGRRLQTIKTPPQSFGNSLALSPDGKILATSGEKGQSILVWDATTGKRTGQIDVPVDRTSVVFLDRGQKLAFFNSDGEITLWDLKQSAVAETAKIGPAVNHGDFAISPKAKYAAIGTFRDTVEVLDFPTGKVLHRIQTPERASPRYLQFSADEKSLYVLRSDNSVQIWPLPQNGK